MNELQNLHALCESLQQRKFRESDSTFLFPARLGAHPFRQDTIVPNYPDVSATGLQTADLIQPTRFRHIKSRRHFGSVSDLTIFCSSRSTANPEALAALIACRYPSSGYPTLATSLSGGWDTTLFSASKVAGSRCISSSMFVKQAARRLTSCCSRCRLPLPGGKPRVPASQARSAPEQA